jgi:HEAT repeat protein
MSSIREEMLTFVSLSQGAQRVPEDLAYKKLLADYGDQLIPGLIECLHDYDSEVRWMTLVILGDGMEPKNDAVIPEIIERLSDEDGFVHCAAVLALTEFGQSARPALEQLKQFLSDDTEPFTRLCAASAISRIAPKDSSSLPILLESLKHEVSFHRIMACDFLGERRDKKSVLNVMPLLGDPNLGVAFAAAEAVGKTFGNWFHAVAVSVKMLKDDDWVTRCAGKESLASLGRYAKADMDLLTMALKEVSWEARLDIEEALYAIKSL